MGKQSRIKRQGMKMKISLKDFHANLVKHEIDGLGNPEGGQIKKFMPCEEFMYKYELGDDEACKG